MPPGSECAKCTTTSTCGFRCYYFWNAGPWGTNSATIAVRSPAISENASTTDVVGTEQERTSQRDDRVDEIDNLAGKKRRIVIDLLDESTDKVIVARPIILSKEVGEVVLRLEQIEPETKISVIENIPRDQKIKQSGETDIPIAAMTSENQVQNPRDEYGYFEEHRQTNIYSKQLPSICRNHSSLPEGKADMQKDYAISNTKSGTHTMSSPEKQPAQRPSEEKKLADRLYRVKRKRKIIFDCPLSVAKSMKAWHSETLGYLDPFRDDDECWLHPSPLGSNSTRYSKHHPQPESPNGSFRPKTTISRTFGWTDSSGKHSLRLNFGIVSKLLNHTLTKQQKDGFITQEWHLSHLCGNWTCLNDRHTTMERGQINVGRNNCFSHRHGCDHTPPCMKDKKRPFAELWNKTGPEEFENCNDGSSLEFDEWSPQFLDGDDDWPPQSFDDDNDELQNSDEIISSPEASEKKGHADRHREEEDSSASKTSILKLHL